MLASLRHASARLAKSTKLSRKIPLQPSAAAAVANQQKNSKAGRGLLNRERLDRKIAARNTTITDVNIRFALPRSKPWPTSGASEPSTLGTWHGSPTKGMTFV
jgi:hypothetical protein